MIEELPAGPGSYALHLLLRDPVRLVVGRLGELAFPAGHYFYLGSAHGPGGLRARLLHHIRIAGHPHWHLDFLRPRADLVEVWWATADQVKSDHSKQAGSQQSARKPALECAWSQALARLPGALVPIRRFGSSDCRSGCRAHLIAFPAASDLELAEITILKIDLCPFPGYKIINHRCLL